MVVVVAALIFWKKARHFDCQHMDPVNSKTQATKGGREGDRDRDRETER